MADPVSFAIATVAQIGISYLFPSEGPRLKDLKMTASTYGAAIPWVFGQTRVPGNMIWALPIKEHKKKKGLGKGGTYNQYTYSCTFAMGLCKGPVKSIRRIWADNKLIYDITGTVGVVTQNNKYRIRFYLGDEDQLPDSAIVADKGAANTPAFRGLAYMIFDDMPLQDFGNRIPQVTVEVYVGDQTNVVGVSPLHADDGTSALPTGFVTTEAAFDFERDFAYLRYDQSVTAINLKTSMAAGTFGKVAFAYPGGADIAKLLCTTRNSAVITSYGVAADRMPIARHDPYSFQTVAHFGVTEHSDTGGPTNNPDGFVAPILAATALTNTGLEFLLTVGSNGQLGLLKADDLTYIWGEDIFLHGAPASGNTYRLCGADADTTGDPTFYLLECTGTAVNLIKIAGLTQTVVQTIAGSSMTIGGAVWDAGMPGVVMFWSDAGGHFISKWSADTSAETWRTPINGFPLIFSGQSRILNSRIGWVTGGSLFLLDTSTGSMTDQTVDAATGEVNPDVGQIDWDDYLARYPAVAAQFEIDGFHVAATPEAYAQWDYEHGGQTAGRTLTYIGSAAGQGYALPTGPTTASLQAYDSSHSGLICFNTINGTVNVNTASSGVTVGTIVQRMLTEGGLQASQIDLTPLFSVPVRGYGWASGTDIKNILDELRRLYLFDIVEREGVLVAIMRGGVDNGPVNPVEVIPQNALGSSSLEASDFWQETRTQEAELPVSVTLAYMNIDNDFETSTARSTRITNPLPAVYSRQQLAMEMNVVMNAVEAKVQANRILYTQWAERTKHDSRFPWAYLDLDPSDVINVLMNDGRLYNERLHRTEIGADFTITAESYGQDSGSYTGWESVISDAGSSEGQVVEVAALALPFIINSPLLRDQDDSGGSFSRYYGGVANGATQPFTGATLYRSNNNIDYDPLFSGDNDIEWGTIVGTLPPPPNGPFALDWKTQLKIIPAVAFFDLESITDDDLWAGLNPCLVGDEVIQFRDAVENTDGTWTIWNLLRCRRGTEYAGNLHRPGERFIFLANTTISLQGDLINSRGQARFFKAVGSGRTVLESTPTQIIYEPRDLMPYAPDDIRREVQTGGDVLITWARRTRLGGNLMDGTGEVALSERTESYEVHILDAPFTGDLSRGLPPGNSIRKFSVTTPQVDYTAFAQAVDGFDPMTSTLHVVIYQLSDAVGLGFPGVRSILATEAF
jgi:hypothetical protein